MYWVLLIKFTTSCHAGERNRMDYLLKPDSLDMIFFALISETYAENILDITHLWGIFSSLSTYSYFAM